MSGTGGFADESPGFEQDDGTIGGGCYPPDSMDPLFPDLDQPRKPPEPEMVTVRKDDLEWVMGFAAHTGSKPQLVRDALVRLADTLAAPDPGESESLMAARDRITESNEARLTAIKTERRRIMGELNGEAAISAVASQISAELDVSDAYPRKRPSRDLAIAALRTVVTAIGAMDLADEIAGDPQ